MSVIGNNLPHSNQAQQLKIWPRRCIQNTANSSKKEFFVSISISTHTHYRDLTGGKALKPFQKWLSWLIRQ